jgi:hypothetical protein
MPGGPAGADRGRPAPSTASWLRGRLRLGAGTATESVRTARALFRGSLSATAQALTGGQIAPTHARVLAQGTHQLPDQVAAEAEPVLLEAAARLDPPQLRQAVGYLRQIVDPEGAARDHQRRHQRRGLWLSATLDNLVAVDGLLEAEAGQTVLAALEPLARPTAPTTPGWGPADPPMPWSSCAAGPWRGGCPRLVGSGPSCWSPSTSTAWPASPVGRWGPGLAGPLDPAGPAAGLGRDGDPGPGHPPPQRPAPRP